MRHWFWISLLVSSISAAAVGAEVYTWKDAAGRTHYSDRPPAEGNAQTVDLDDQRVSVIGATELRTAEKDLLGQLEEARALRQQQEEINRPVNITVVKTEEDDDDDLDSLFFPAFSTHPALLPPTIHPHHQLHHLKKHRSRFSLHGIYRGPHHALELEVDHGVKPPVPKPPFRPPAKPVHEPAPAAHHGIRWKSAPSSVHRPAPNPGSRSSRSARF